MAFITIIFIFYYYHYILVFVLLLLIIDYWFIIIRSNEWMQKKNFKFVSFCFNFFFIFYWVWVLFLFLFFVCLEDLRTFFPTAGQFYCYIINTRTHTPSTYINKKHINRFQRVRFCKFFFVHIQHNLFDCFLLVCLFVCFNLLLSSSIFILSFFFFWFLVQHSNINNSIDWLIYWFRAIYSSNIYIGSWIWSNFFSFVCLFRLLDFNSIYLLSKHIHFFVFYNSRIRQTDRQEKNYLKTQCSFWPR